MNMMDKKNFPLVTAIIMPGKNRKDTINSLMGCNDTQAEIIFCANHIGAALARAKGDYICILPAGTLLHEEYFAYPLAYLERHQEFDYSVCDQTYSASQGNSEGVHEPAFTSLQITDYFLGHFTVETAAFLVRKTFLLETGILSIIADCTFPALLSLPFLAFGYGVHIEKSLYTAEKSIILSQEWNAYVSEAHDMIKRFPIPISDIRELLLGFDFMTARKLLSAYDRNMAENIWEYIGNSINHAFNPSPCIPLMVFTDSVKSNKSILLTALNHACAGKSVKNMKPGGRVIAYAPLFHSALKIKALLHGTAYEPNTVWAMNGDGISATIPDPTTLTPKDIIVVSRRYPSLEKEFSPASIVSVQDALSHCAAIAFPSLCNGNTTIRFSSGYFYDY
jgi:hypothetical protein